MTIQSVVDFIHEQRRVRGAHRVCRNWNDGELATSIQKAISNNTFGWVTEGEKISGIAWGFKHEKEKVLDVNQVVCAGPRDLAHLMLLFSQVYPDWTIRGYRSKHHKNKLVDYKRTARFVHLTQLKAI